MNDILSRIKDKRLRELLEAYKSTNIDFGLIDIMNYFGVKFRIDAIEAIMPKFEIDNNKIRLGGFIINSTLYGVYLEITEQKITLRIGVEYYILVTRENKTEKE